MKLSLEKRTHLKVDITYAKVFYVNYYYMHVHVYPAANMKKVKHLVELPGANTKLTLWKADLSEEGSFDEAIKGCTGVFHVATPMDFESKDPEVYTVTIVVKMLN